MSSRQCASCLMLIGMTPLMTQGHAPSLAVASFMPVSMWPRRAVPTEQPMSRTEALPTMRIPYPVDVLGCCVGNGPEVAQASVIPPNSDFAFRNDIRGDEQAGVIHARTDKAGSPRGSQEHRQRPAYRPRGSTTLVRRLGSICRSGIASLLVPTSGTPGGDGSTLDVRSSKPIVQRRASEPARAYGPGPAIPRHAASVSGPTGVFILGLEGAT